MHASVTNRCRSFVRSVIVAVFVALVVAILLTPQLIKVLTRAQLGSPILDEDGPGGQPPPRGIPTMTGVVIIVAMWAGYAAAMGVQLAAGGGGPTASGWLLLLLSTGLGAVGLADDYLKVRKAHARGLNRWVKLTSRALIAGVFGVLAMRLPGRGGLTPASIHLSYARDLPWLTLGAAGLVLLAVAASVGWSSGVHLVDGVDGLAVGIGGMMLAVYTLISFYQARQSCLGTHLAAAAVHGCYQVRDPLDIATIAAAGLGACFGGLWWNAHPARISLGSSGSFTLGGLLAGLSILSRTELLALVAGAVVVMEALSVAVQYAGYQTRRTRIFATAPLHEHFQLAGWTEATVMVRFWVLAAISAAAAAVLFYADWLSRTGG